jgi:hypothetical protein
MTIKHKFHAERCEREGVKFASKAERRFYDQLKMLQRSGDVLFFLMQVPFHLPGGIIYRCDFLVFNSDETCDVIDVKGVETAEFKLKRKLLEDSYPVKLKIVS